MHSAPGAARSGSPTEPRAPRGPVGAAARFFVDAWAAIDREAAEERRAHGERFDPRPLAVLVLVALVLIFEAYAGDRPTFDALFPRLLPTRYGALLEYAWWAGAKIVGLLFVTLIALRVARARAADWGLGLGELRPHLRIYLGLYLAILPILVAASFSSAFQATYPFYRQAARSVPDCLAWEAMYGATFVAVEAFFRGLMLFPLRRALGSSAIFVMTVPYCMVHFPKPLPEVVGAVFAGVLLGTLAMRSRSIWGGVLLHVAVAWTMDALALAQTTGWPGNGRYVGP